MAGFKWTFDAQGRVILQCDNCNQLHFRVLREDARKPVKRGIKKRVAAECLECGNVGRISDGPATQWTGLPKLGDSQ